MKLSEFVGNLQQLMINNPENAELDVVFSIDDEGNEFKMIHLTPSLGNFSEEDREFQTDEYLDDIKINAVCVN